jgi:hypothetical protein
VHAPLALLPVPYPRETFLRAQRAALAFNSMIDAVAQDETYLQNVLAAAAQEDEFTASSWPGGGRHACSAVLWCSVALRLHDKHALSGDVGGGHAINVCCSCTDVLCCSVLAGPLAARV